MVGVSSSIKVDASGQAEFSLVLLQTKVVGELDNKPTKPRPLSFSLVLLQTKVVGRFFLLLCLSMLLGEVFISSPSNEGGGKDFGEKLMERLAEVFISSPSNEGGGQLGGPIRASAGLSVFISSPSNEGGGSSVFKPRHSKGSNTPNIRTPLAKESTWRFLPK